MSTATILRVLRHPSRPWHFRLARSLKTITDAVRLGRFTLSFNGGKDCTLLLHLITAALYIQDNGLSALLDVDASLNEYFDGDSASLTVQDGKIQGSILQGSIYQSLILPLEIPPIQIQPIKCIYVTTPDAFPLVDAFINNCVTEYHLNVRTLLMGMKEALRVYLEEEKEVKCVFMGNRRTDPHSANLNPFTETDGNWPRVMRVFPLLDWSYANIWAAIIELKIPVCELYNVGYTSLGCIHDTLPNPILRYGDVYRPAWELEDESMERAGRVKK